ncbi:GNAT family N-acetyltransferase [Ramlibacter sp. XY19]|uniref:GNAT family N-acetyltransferase n=1 Tax=Ramlibacter paludis TaxID=2908000 RepID=UPI0023DA05D2|nr:GNAT family N-acetyltransferase [Ramlibacter paludis]MCG2593961.1 GNAT family N-acetyltransferase [Ramlibacter paludis]
MIDPLLIDLPDTIETERLTLRTPRTGDGAQLLPALEEALPQLRRFLASLPWVAGEQTPDSAERWCRNAQANFHGRKDLPFLIFERASGQLLGACGLHRTVWETPRTEVGYWIRSSRAGQGFVTEAVKGLCNYAFMQIGAVRVELIVDEDNLASRRVADLAGFRLEGTLRNERRAPDGTLRNTCAYARFPTPQY